MAPDLTANPMLVTRRIEEVSGIRPVTLLIASGIALIIAILMVTGIAANHLRAQALATASSDLARVDALVAESASRSLTVVDAQLGELASRIESAAPATEQAFRRAAAAPELGAALARELARAPRVSGIAIVAADGTAIQHAGNWPASGTAESELAAAMKGETRPGSSLGAVLHAQGNVAGIPLVHPLAGSDGKPLGAVVAVLPPADFTSLFAAVPLAADTTIELLRADGSILAAYPEQTGAHPARGGKADATGTMVGNLTATIVRRFAGSDGKWQIEALHAVSGYPAAVAVRRGANQVLAEWAYQGLWFGGFALVLAAAIGIMVYLIARQFHTHATLAAMRADKIEAEKVEIERARLAAEAELLKKERLSVLGQLTATVAHELRNPLSAIRNTLFTVKELSATAGIKLDRPLSRMERSIERCDRIISDLLEYTRHRDLNRSTVRFDRWLGDILAEQHVAAPIAIVPELAAGEEIVPIDPDRFRRVVINLVENAAQALAETAPDREKKIAVRTAVVGRELVLAVEDTGPGIKPENLARIFEPLFSTKTFGTGLGLPTVKQIVNQHGGTIEVESEVGSGTRVTVTLPLAAAPADQASEVKEAA